MLLATYGQVMILLLASFLNNGGDVIGKVGYQDGEFTEVVTYLVTGCETPRHRWVVRENLATPWTKNGPKVADMIATELCYRHFPMGSI